eukprot:gb/GECG01001156.1/.p1 GENE.gb/GECG01001156.1/~~gb/GECG01001156.1/.p1  ORF type:complete len:237 (+),score=28.39 gb/GECG01001156.1/:1-711(+)
MNDYCNTARQLLAHEVKRLASGEEDGGDPLPFKGAHLVCYNEGNKEKTLDERIEWTENSTSSDRIIRVVCRDCTSALPIPDPQSKDGRNAESSTAEAEATRNMQENPQLKGRAFYSFPPASVTLCTNGMRSSNDIEDALLHEMSHASDHSILGMDLRICGVLACSEIRASTFAECRKKAIKPMKRSCVSSRAHDSTQMVFPETGAECVRAVWSSCFESSRGVNPTASLQEYAEKQR